MAYLPQAQNTPWQQSSDIDWSQTAVLVIDVLGGSEGVTPGLEDMAEAAVRLVKAVRGKQVPVFFCDDAHLPGSDRELELWGDHGIKGTEAAQPLAAFEICDSDYLVPKRRYDAFFDTDLELTLRELGITTLVVCGCDTNICVLHTLAGAYYRGFKTIVAGDACGTFLIGTQEDGLDYFTRCFDSRVVDTQSLVDALA